MSSRFTAYASPADVDLVSQVEEIAHKAGERLLALYSPSIRPTDRQSMLTAARANEEAAAAGLRAALEQARPDARFSDEQNETSSLPDGEWWVVDTVEGNVNHVHGLSEWCVSIALVRDNVPVLTVIRQPVGDLTFTAVLDGGAFVNDVPLRVSAKNGLDIAVVSTGQAEAGQADTYRRIGESITAMLGSALAVRAQVPSTFPILLVAAGHSDAFWQYEPNLPGVAAGVLLTTEAGGTVSTIDGGPWAPGADTILIAAPGVHAAALDVLGSVS
ncbi:MULTISPECIES: inositol monophosphatase family protein [Subtercola]|uniref:3'(2'),5'-bisphosphate nucleotidase CysQ n=1 Tax=Subtercola vilae TaxID=2056433 RepID=A0A4T2C5L1_9MICO|nr:MULTISPECIES: inositol monophosphatase family protein [Subtercola]MEA9984727.1 inositol monophosphatase family protein [Subtercola sp. RTI3]TIH39029.1 3'(2'),5'-bisphosphate nucleotidase CysQ [Subtercola vilae]